jgi:RNA polymerase sigma factor (sigma-70 family)
MAAHTNRLLCHLLRLTWPATSDAALLARWVEQRDEAAFADLVARHGPMVLGVCRRVLGDVQHAEDAFQATFLVLARKAARLRRPDALPGFLYGVALRLARKARGAARRWTIQPHSASPEPADPQRDPLDALSGRELLAALDEEIARLPEAYRLPVLLCVLQERPVEEAARLLGWSSGSVRGRLARGRALLRARLTRRGLAPSLGAVALLAPAVVPERLLAAALHNLTAPAAPAVHALAAGPTPAVKLQAACLGLFLVAVSVGAGLSLLHAPAPEIRVAAAPAAPAPAAAEAEPRRDLAGDPLPPGALARLGTLRFRAPDEIDALAFAPDGKIVAVSSRAGLFLFEAASGKRIKRLPASEAMWRPENRLAFSPDGKRLAARGNIAVDQQGKTAEVVRMWELAGSRDPRHYEAEHMVWLGWSAGGEPLAVCLEAGALRLRELAADRSRRFPCADLPRPELSGYTACAYAPAGATLAVVDEQRRVIHVWDTATGKKRCTCQSQETLVPALALSADGHLVASLTPESVRLWDATTGKPLHTVATEQQYLATLAFAPDGKTLATAGWSGVRFWDTATGRERSRSQGIGAGTRSIAFAPDGQTLVTAEEHTGTFHLWDVATGQRKPEPVGHRCRPQGTAFSPDGRRVVTGGGLDGTIHVWDLATGASLLHIDRPKQWVRDVALSPDGRWLFSTWIDDNLWICDAATGERRHVIKLEDPDRPDTYQSAIAMHLSDDGQRLVAQSYYYARKGGGGPLHAQTLITGWDAATRKQLFRRRRPGLGTWSALSADARVLAVAHSSEDSLLREIPPGPMRLEDVATGEVLLTFPMLEGQTWPLAFSPDGRLLAAINSDWKRRGKKDDPLAATGYAVHLWETATGASVRTFPATDDNPHVAFSPDGRLLALTPPGQEILLWDLVRGRELRRFKGFDAAVTWLAFAPDGRRFISGFADSTLLVWDAGTQEPAPASKLDADGVAAAWTDLGSADAARAFRARGAFVSSPEEALALLKGRLRRAQAADPQRVRTLLADLDSERFAVREKAQADLEALGELAEAALRQALANKPTLELRRRVQQALDHLHRPVTSPEVLRPLRGLAILEDIATPDARALLEALASGAAEARLTREAKASLGRLDRRKPVPH